jgi:hypothetical protein
MVVVAARRRSTRLIDAPCGMKHDDMMEYCEELSSHVARRFVQYSRGGTSCCVRVAPHVATSRERVSVHQHARRTIAVMHAWPR